MTDALLEMIERNENLMHLNLEATGIGENTMISIAEAITTAKQLLSVHLSFNVGVTSAAKDSLREILTVPDSTHAHDCQTNETLGQN